MTKNNNMTINEFNIKYFSYLEEGHYGLDISIPPVIEYLDKIFSDLIKLPGFKYQQIKLKFNMARFYFITDLKELETPLMIGIEERIDSLVKKWDKENGK